MEGGEGLGEGRRGEWKREVGGEVKEGWVKEEEGRTRGERRRGWVQEDVGGRREEGRRESKAGRKRLKV